MYNISYNWPHQHTVPRQLSYEEHSYQNEFIAVEKSIVVNITELPDATQHINRQLRVH